MLESIRHLADIPATDSVLLTREDRIAARNRSLLMHAARKRAKSLVAEAVRDSDIIRANAFQDGYSKGVLQAGGDLAGLLLKSKVLAGALQVELLEAARALLNEWLTDEEVFNKLLQQWHGRQGKSLDVLQIILPLRCKSQLASLKNTLKDMGVSCVEIRFHCEERYLFRLSDQVLELDIDAARERLSPRLIAQIKELPGCLRQLDECSRQVLFNWVASFNEGVNNLNPSLQLDDSDEH